MDWLFMGGMAIAFGGGYWVHSHLTNLATNAAKAVTAATTLHTGTPLDSVVKTAGADVSHILTGASTSQNAASPAVSAATLAALSTLGK